MLESRDTIFAATSKAYATPLAGRTDVLCCPERDFAGRGLDFCSGLPFAKGTPKGIASGIGVAGRRPQEPADPTPTWLLGKIRCCQEAVASRQTLPPTPCVPSFVKPFYTHDST